MRWTIAVGLVSLALLFGGTGAFAQEASPLPAPGGSPVPVTADFVADVTSGPAPLTVNFTDLSVGPVSCWDWGVNGVLVSTDKDLTYTFTAPGLYTIIHRASYPWVCDREEKVDYIWVTGVAADFTADATVGIVPLTVNFTDGSAGAAACWDWGVNGVLVGTDKDLTYTFTTPGLYTVNHRASYPYTCDVEEKTDYISVWEPASADFIGAPVSGVAPLTVQFTDISTGHIACWWWDFGDGAGDGVQNPSHTYTAAGTYTVTQYSSNDPWSCDSEQKVDYITVAPGQTWFEDDDPGLIYTGTWVRQSHPSATAGHAKYSLTKNNQVSFTFHGTSFRWHTAKGPNQGKASVYLDGHGPTSLDLYSATLQKATFSKAGLANTSHTVVITVSGTKNSASTGYRIYIDALEGLP